MVGNQTMLEHQQFDLIVRLMNAALQDSDIDMHGVAAALLPLACTFGIKDLYLAIQDQGAFNSHHGVMSAQLSVERHV